MMAIIMNKPPLYELHCPVKPDTLCPAKVAIIKEATGDPTGRTPIEKELAEHFVQAKFREQNLAGRLLEHGDIIDVCPVRETMNTNVVRRSVLDLARGGFRRLSGRQNT